MEELATLVLAVREGKIEFFGEIIRRFQDMACGYAYSQLGDFHKAEDAAQEAFIEAYSKIADLREPKAFPGWFRKIVFKHCDRLKRGKQLETIALDAVHEIPCQHPSPDQALEASEMKARVLEAISALPIDQREATTLFYINGYSQTQVAEFLEVPLTTVKKRLHDSRRKLKEDMMDMVEKTLKDNAPSDEFEKKLLQRMQPSGIWGEWVDEGDERLAVFKNGPWTTLVSPQTWPGNAVVAEFDARGEKESDWGLGWEASFSPYKTPEECKAHDYAAPKYAVRCGFKERYVWSTSLEIMCRLRST